MRLIRRGREKASRCVFAFCRTLRTCCTAILARSIVSCAASPYNAIKFTSAGHVRLRVEGGMREGLAYIRVEIRDTGPGLPRALRSGERRSSGRGIPRSPASTKDWALVCRWLRPLLGCSAVVLGLETGRVGGGTIVWFEIPVQIPAGGCGNQSG